MARTRVSESLDLPHGNHAQETIERENLADSYDGDFTENFDSVLDADSEFDVEEDIAFLGEDYDVLNIDDVLEMCNVSKRDSLKN